MDPWVWFWIVTCVGSVLLGFFIGLGMEDSAHLIRTTKDGTR